MYDADYDQYLNALAEEAASAPPEAGGFIVRDSGRKAVHPDGVQRDTSDGKPRFDLLFPRDVPYEDQLVTRTAMQYMRGGVKYGDRNWENSRTEDTLAHHEAALMRHVVKFLTGTDDGEDHAAAIVWNVNAVDLTRRNLCAPSPADAFEDETDGSPQRYVFPLPDPANPGSYEDHPVEATSLTRAMEKFEHTCVSGICTHLQGDEIAWRDGDRVTEAAPPPYAAVGSWIYSWAADVWYFADSVPGVPDRSARSFRNVCKEFGPLRVTQGEYTGLIFTKEGEISYGNPGQ